MKKPQYNIGKLDRRILLEEKQNIKQDVMGQAYYDWIPIQRVWAKMDHRSGVEAYAAQRESNIESVFWTIRYRSDINETWRIIYESNEYQIHAIKPKGRRDYLELKTQQIK